MDIGITGYGAYVPKYRIKADEIARVWNQNAKNIKDSLMIEEKAVADIDEDTITMSVESAKNALWIQQIQISGLMKMGRALIVIIMKVLFKVRLTSKSGRKGRLIVLWQRSLGKEPERNIIAL